MTTDLWPQIIIAASTLLAAFLGFVFAGMNEARRDRRTAEREKTTRAEEQRATAIRERHQFQLETLLALQDAIQLKVRLTGRTMHFDHMQARQGKYTQLPENYSEEMHANGVNVIRLRNRLLDDNLRDALEQFEARCVDLTMSPKRYQGLEGDDLERTARSLSARFGEDVTTIMNHVGTALRTELNWLPDTP